jgi:hypothetical protein
VDIPQADFLTPGEFCRGPDLLRPGSLTGKHVDPTAIAFIYTLLPLHGDESEIQVSPADRHLIYWPASIGHEMIADRESVLRAMFGADYREATKAAAYPRQSCEPDASDARLVYDTIEPRRLAVQKNLFGRYGRVRGVSCLMLWNRCENWDAMLDRLLDVLDAPDGGLVTLGNTDQWWIRDWKGRRLDDDGGITCLT